MKMDSAPCTAPSIARDALDAEALSGDELECEITVLAAHIHAATYRLLVLIGELDRRGGWGAWGLCSCAHWLNWRCGIDLGAAREKVRVARALAGLPRVSDAFGKGELSYSKVRAMTRVATPGNEDYLLMIARYGTASHMERLVRAYRGVSREEEMDEQQKSRHESRGLSWRYAEDGSMVITCRLAPEQGEVVVKAIEAAVAGLEQSAQEGATVSGESAEVPVGLAEGVSAETCEVNVSKPRGVSAETCATRGHGATFAGKRRYLGEALPSYVLEDGVTRPLTGDEREALVPEEWEPVAARRADGLVVMAETLLAHGATPLSGGERTLLTIHVDAGVLAGAKEAGACALEHGAALSRKTLERLGCDASVVALVENARGEVLDVGRRTRSIPPAMRRALRSRDGGCRFPGCGRHRFVDGHHIEHWADGGETRLDNLVQLCRAHHAMVHEGGYAVASPAPGELVFRRPDGRVIETAPVSPVAGRCDGGEVVEQNVRLGLGIDADTGACHWDGQPMDLAMAVDGMAQADGRIGGCAASA